MKIRFDWRIEAIFLFIALLGTVARTWILGYIPWPTQLLLIGISMLIFNTIWAFHYWFNSYLNQHLPFERGMGKRVAVQLLGGWGVVKTGLLLFVYLILNHILPQVGLFVNRLNFVSLALGAFLANTVLGLGFIAHHFFHQWQANLTRAAQLEKEKTQVQLDNLKNQINPHFLFNSLSSLDSLIDDNPVLARQFLQQLSRVFRYVLQSKERDVVTLETELAFIDHYVSLLQTRFDGALTVDCRIARDTPDRQIVPVTLQILIDNAIKHNVISDTYPLTITLRSDADSVSVSNPIQRKQRVETSHRQGLKNLTALYRYLSPQPVLITETDAVFCVRVPLLTTEPVRGNTPATTPSPGTTTYADDYSAD